MDQELPLNTDIAAHSDELVYLRDVSVRFERRQGLLSRQKVTVEAVDGVTLTVKRGRTLGVVGETGSGKSTIAHVIMGIVEPTAGSVIVAGRDRAHERPVLRRFVQVVLQDPYSSLDPRMKVRDIIAEPLTLGRWQARKSTRSQVDRRVSELLEVVGIPAHLADRYPHQFSGGQRQRISIARALAPEPKLIVLDEPTSALDVSVRAQILKLLKALQEELGVTFLMISHDLVTVAYLASEVAVMHEGRIVESGPTADVYRTPRHPFTVELLASAPGESADFLHQAQSGEEESVISSSPQACPYAGRCALRTQLGDPRRCVEENPALVQIGENHSARCHFSSDVARLAESNDWVERAR